MQTDLLSFQELVYCLPPLRQIAYNAGLEGSVVVEKVKNTEAGVGFNALTEEYIDMVKAGIVDPAKVTRSAMPIMLAVPSLLPWHFHTLPLAV